MGKVGLIVQARMGSSRLPGKSMLPLAGEPLVFRILERLQKVRNIDQLVLAIPDSIENLVLKTVASRLRIPCFQGSEDDLLDRYYQASTTFDFDVIVRVPADNVASEPYEIEKIIDLFKHNDFDFCSNLHDIMDSGYPDGIGAEVFSMKTLDYFWKTEKDKEKREHISLNFLDKKSKKPLSHIKIGFPKCPLEYRRPDIILDVNTPEQYELMKKMYDDLYREDRLFTIKDIVKWWDRN